MAIAGKVIHIKSADVLDTTGGGGIQAFALRIGSRECELRYEVNAPFGSALCSDRCDGVVVTLVSHAMRYGYDIVSDVPMSSDLHYKLTKHLIPQLSRRGAVHVTEVSAPLAEPRRRGSLVATGISCGVDSLATLCEYTTLCGDEADRVTHLLYFKVGAHDGQMDHWDGAVEDRLYREQCAFAQRFCDRYGYPLIVVESNLSEILVDNFGFESFELTETYRNAGTALLLQGLLRRYYYASSYDIDVMRVSLRVGASHYSKYLVPYLSTDGLEVFEANESWTRIDKTRIISDFEPSWDSLLVCWMKDVNCGCCDKCIRTLMTLDYLGVIDRYAASFDVESYRRDKDRLQARAWNRSYLDPFYAELVAFAKKKGLAPPPVFARFVEFFSGLIPEMTGKLVRKVRSSGVRGVVQKFTER